VDGLRPDVGHEVLWVVRDCASGEILLARPLLSEREADLVTLLKEVQGALSVPIQGTFMKREAKKIDGAAPSSYGAAGLVGRENTLRAQKDVSASNPGPENLPLQQQNPNSNLPPDRLLYSPLEIFKLLF
jgi:hypothetical protein